MRYRWRRLPEDLENLGPWSQGIGLNRLMWTIVARRMRRWGAPFRRKWRGQPWMGWQPKPFKFRRHLRAQLKNADAGDVVWIQVGGEDGPKFALLAFDPSPPDSTIGNSAVDRIVTWVETNFSRVESFGICNRRPIDGTDPPVWTQHCPWPDPDPGSNAWDFHHDSFSVQRDVALGLGVQGKLFAETAGARGIPVGKILHDRQVWTPEHGWRPAPNLADPHVGHGHVEGFPTRTGDPRPGCP